MATSFKVEYNDGSFTPVREAWKPLEELRYVLVILFTISKKFKEICI